MNTRPLAIVPLPAGCVAGRFRRRLKRFSIEFELNGKTAWAHTNNTGAMLGLLRPNAPILLSPAANPARKLPYTLERVWVGCPDGPGFWAGVNTLLPNRIIAAAFRAGALPFAAGYSSLRMEARRGESRLDARFDGPGLPTLWLECKNATLVEDDRVYFPDAPTRRGLKHLAELVDIVRSGQRAGMFYLAQRPDGRCFAPADFIDAEYARQYHAARAAGVEIHVWRSVPLPHGDALGGPVRLAPEDPFS